MSLPSFFKLRRAIREADMLAEERRQIAQARERSLPETGPSAPWFGLALSGGGIRSATFCLGALQRLAGAGLLKHFDYLSSVSGGGYTACSLYWWWKRDVGADASAGFPYGTGLDDSNERLKFVRERASYLAPGGGLSTISIFAAVLRTVLLSMFVWLPVATATMLVIHAAGAPSVFAKAIKNLSMPGRPEWSDLLWSKPVPAFAVCALWGIAIVIGIFLLFIGVLVLSAILVPQETTTNRSYRVKYALRWAIVGGLVFFIGYYYYRGLLNFAKLDYPEAAVLYVAFVMVGLGGVAVVVAAAQLAGLLEWGVNYKLRVFFDQSATWLFAFLVFFATLASLPFVVDILADRAAQGIVTLFGLLSGIVSGLYGHLVQAQKVAPKLVWNWGASLAAALFIYALILAAYVSSDFLLDPSSPSYPKAIADRGPEIQRIFPALLLCAIIFGVWSNLNHLGLHRFYRDRLMEAFLPENDPLQKSREYPERHAMAEFWPIRQSVSGVEIPYPLINTNAIMVNDHKPMLRLRGGDSFVLSPLFVGSSATNWASADNSQYSGLSLASAMAASGAAASANAAYIGSGVTRNAVLSIVMMLLNVRLGLWIDAPGAKAGTPDFFSPGLRYGVFRSGYKSGSAYVELTDGGHFDNLGVYELVRRRLDVIVAIDSEEDRETAMSALASVCQRVQEDFGVLIDIQERANKLAPVDDLGYPPLAKFTQRSFFFCPIRYPDAKSPIPGDGGVAKEGVFVYVKSNMIKGLSFPVRGYKAKNADFPNQPTMDQFFDPDQFEAYRELGYRSAGALISDLLSENAGALKLLAAIRARC